ncbi:MAG: hypothetical protein JRK53_10900 [Deltaproteobacteria bacterium]|nr:hypothetical protein [Deltaproteobacteria bacterium]
MKLSKKNIVLFVAAAAVAAVFSVAGAGSPAYGAERYFTEEKPLPGHYPKRFSGMGRIDRISGNEVVIDDSLYGLSVDVTYGTPSSRKGSYHRFRPGTFVGFVVSSKRTIVSLWLIE